MPKAPFDPQMVKQTLRLIHPPGGVIEIRMPKSGRLKTVSGYFDDVDALVNAVSMYTGKPEVPGIYFTLNECDPALLARCANTLMPYADVTTADADIISRRALGIDFDPKRPAKISSTGDERAAAIAQAKKCRAWLSAMEWPEPILGDSGNGGHLVYGLNLSNDEATATLLSRVLMALELYQGTPEIMVDTSVFNAARVWKLYGTMARKGSDIRDRPHRLSTIIEAPERLTPVPFELLHALADMAPPPPEPTTRTARSLWNGDRTIDAARRLADCGIEVIGTKGWKGGTLYKLAHCPWNPDYTANDAHVIQFANGALEAGCFHNSCRGKGWRDLPAQFDRPRGRSAMS
jgi:hypothetical protein